MGHGINATMADIAVVTPSQILRVQFSDLGSGVTDTLSFANAVPADVAIIWQRMHFDNETAWTVGGGTTTGLDTEGGDSGDPNGLFTTIDLVGLATGLSGGTALGAEAGDGLIIPHIGPYTPAVLVTATGGATELDDADAGDAVFIYSAIGIPGDLYAYTDRP